MLGWSTKRVARLVEEALRGAPAGTIAVVGEPPLAKALAAGGREVTASADGGELAALVGVGEGNVDDWARAVRDGGVLVLVHKVAPHLATRWALCAAVHDLEQRASGKIVVTSGRVRRWS